MELNAVSLYGEPMVRPVLLLVIPLLIAAAPSPASTAFPPGPVQLRPRPGAPADATARQLAAQDLAEAARSGEAPLVLTGSAVLGKPTDAPALFVQLQSPRECGSAGCETAIYLREPAGWRKVLDSVSGEIVVDRAQHRGMHDLVAGPVRYAWNGTAYADTRAAPAVDVRPRQRRR